MSLDRPNLTSFNNVRRILLSILTVLVVIKLIFSLIATKDRPQIQGKFELYQTNLVLEASAWEPTGEFQELNQLKTALVGVDLLKSATQQYQTARESDLKTIEQLKSSLTDPAKIELDGTELKATAINQTIAAGNVAIDKLDLRIGILQAAQKQPAKAIETWQKVATHLPKSTSAQTAKILIDIWQEPSQVDAKLVPKIAAEIDANLDGWFRDCTQQQLFKSSGKANQLGEQLVQARAQTALIKLVTIFTSRIGFGVGGLGLLIFFTIRSIIQLIQKQPNQSISDVLLEKISTPWESPWNWEIVWQVFMVGFFFVGQFLLPTIFSQFINPSKLTIQSQAIYVFSSYVTMACLGIGVLYLSIKSDLPPPEDWFKFNWRSNWLLWGIGGFLVANPIVIVVSLLNEKIWQGQGGSNPLLEIVLGGKDSGALLLFFLTAAVAAPLFEEFMFRGFLLPSLTRYVPVWASIGISGLLFGVAHLSLSEILPLTTLGIILGVVYARTRNLLAPMLLHSLWNSSTLISLYILGSGN